MAKAKLGSGARFKALAKKVGSPALAAYVGRKKYGNAKMTSMAKAGKAKMDCPTCGGSGKVSKGSY